MATMAAFYETRNIYREYASYTGPLSFEEWDTRPEDQKAAILFVQFFNEITLAWDKANTFDFIDDADGVSVVCQYLQKNITRIKEDPKRFSPRYIYRVAYNCMYCICHDRKCDKDRWENETSSIVSYDGKELCLFDSISDGSGSAEEIFERSSFEEEFWSVIEDAGMSAEKVMRYLLSGNPSDLKKLDPRNKAYKADPLAQVSVPFNSVESVLEDLRERFLCMPLNSQCGVFLTEMYSEV